MDKIKRTVKFFLGIGILVTSYYLGEVLSYAADGFISPGVMGMIVLFLLLKLGIVKVEWVESVSNFLLDNLMLFFIPATAGVALISFAEIRHEAVAIFASAVVSSFIVLWIVGYSVKKLEGTDDK